MNGPAIAILEHAQLFLFRVGMGARCLQNQMGARVCEERRRLSISAFACGSRQLLNVRMWVD